MVTHKQTNCYVKNFTVTHWTVIITLIIGLSVEHLHAQLVADGLQMVDINFTFFHQRDCPFPHFQNEIILLKHPLCQYDGMQQMHPSPGKDNIIHKLTPFLKKSFSTETSQFLRFNCEITSVLIGLLTLESFRISEAFAAFLCS